MEIDKIIVPGFSIVISLAALVLSIKNVGYSRINMFNIIQNMILQKAKDCNQVYSNDYNEWLATPGVVPHINNTVYLGSTIAEVYLSVKLLENTLKEFRIPYKVDYFLLQFWYQVNSSIRSTLRMADVQPPQNEEQKQQQYLHKLFLPIFPNH